MFHSKATLAINHQQTKQILRYPFQSSTLLTESALRHQWQSSNLNYTFLGELIVLHCRGSNAWLDSQQRPAWRRIPSWHLHCRQGGSLKLLQLESFIDQANITSTLRHGVLFYVGGFNCMLHACTGRTALWHRQSRWLMHACAMWLPSILKHFFVFSQSNLPQSDIQKIDIVPIEKHYQRILVTLKKLDFMNIELALANSPSPDNLITCREYMWGTKLEMYKIFGESEVTSS